MNNDLNDPNVHRHLALRQLCGVSALLLGTMTHGAPVEFGSMSAWSQEVGEFSTLSFTGFPSGALVTDQYAGMGVLFTDQADFIQCCSSFLYPEDGAGLSGGFEGEMHLSFAQVIYGIAAHFPGEVWFSLYRDGELVHQSSTLGLGGVGNFRGVVVDEGFDSAITRDPVDGFAYLDNLYVTIPGPGSALFVLAMSRAFHRRVRRNQSGLAGSSCSRMRSM